MIRLFAVLGLVALAACGADGEPETPTARVGVNASTSGVSAAVGVGMGPVFVSVGGLL